MEMCIFWYLQRRRVFLHKMIMIFGEGSIYGECLFWYLQSESIKWLWEQDQYLCVYFDIYRVFLHKMIMYLAKDQYMEMCSFWYLQRRVCYIKYVMIFVKGSIYADVFILIFTEYCYIKWLCYLAKDQYMEMYLFWYFQSGVLLHKIIMIFVKGSIYGDVFILIFTEESIFT